MRRTRPMRVQAALPPVRKNTRKRATATHRRGGVGSTFASKNSGTGGGRRRPPRKSIKELSARRPRDALTLGSMPKGRELPMPDP